MCPQPGREFLVCRGRSFPPLLGWGTNNHEKAKIPAGVPAIELEGNQLRELGRNVCHVLFCGAQAAS